jgi:hypothetical protein
MAFKLIAHVHKDLCRRHIDIGNGAHVKDDGFQGRPVVFLIERAGNRVVPWAIASARRLVDSSRSCDIQDVISDLVNVVIDCVSLLARSLAIIAISTHH